VHLKADPEALHTAGAILIPGGETKAGRWASTREAVARYRDGHWAVDPPAVHAGINRVRRFADFTHPSWIEWEAANGRLPPKGDSWKFRTRASTVTELTRRLTTLADEANRLHTPREQLVPIVPVAVPVVKPPPSSPPASPRRLVRLVSLTKTPDRVPSPLEQLALFPA
jgi:hypothetical protein